jgi:hypothetical protein
MYKYRQKELHYKRGEVKVLEVWQKSYKSKMKWSEVWWCEV